MQQHASCPGNISVSPPLLGVFMTGLGMKKEAHSTLLHPYTTTPPSSSRLCSDGVIHERALPRLIAIKAPKTHSWFLTIIRSTMMAPLIYLCTGKWKEGGGLLPALSMLLVAYVTFGDIFLMKTYPCMRRSTKWKSPWDKALNTVNGTKRQAERGSSASWTKFKTSPLRLHYCRHSSRSGG